MTAITIRIDPLDSVMIRDGRPFDATPGASAHSMDSFSPSVVAGSIRTVVGKSFSSAHVSTSFSSQVVAQFLKKSVARGPLYLFENRIFYPFPQDINLHEEDGSLRVNFLRPCSVNSDQGFLGTDRIGKYENHLWPATQASSRKLWSGKPAYVSAEWMHRWLCESLTEQEWVDALTQWKEACGSGQSLSQPHFLAAFQRETRVHTKIDQNTYTAEDKMLFSTELVTLPTGLSLLTELQLSGERPVSARKELNTLHSFGGKRRLAHFQEITASSIWEPPATIKATLAAPETKYVRMLLVTPAYFAKGWLPAWLDDNLRTTEQFDPEITLQLRWVCLSRWEPVSGWSYKEGAAKPIRRMVPAGSVYFFEVVQGNLENLAERHWLKSVSDHNRRKAAFDKDDGFGLAVWGTWQPASRNEKENGLEE